MTKELRTIAPPPQRLLVFARVPESGRVKTRLAATLGAEKALRVYEAMLRDLLDNVGTSTAETEVEIMWAPAPDVDGARLRRLFGDRAMAMQTGASLGERMSMAFSERFFFHRAQKIIAIGIDDPTLNRDTINDAFGLLDSCEWVLGPAVDGGYYLIGCRGPAFNPEIFSGIHWGTSAVFDATLARIRQWEATLALLPRRSDIDVEDDLRHFARNRHDGELASLVRSWGWS
jgi:rSAM/selenodomain-associated transferase 1